MENIYEYFDIDKKSSKEQIKKAYRKKAKKVHPDLNKGSDVEFKKANYFYQILLTDSSRMEYDETGEIKDRQRKETLLSFVFEHVNGVIMAAEQLGKLEEMNIIKKTIVVIDNEIKGCHESISGNNKRIDSMEKLSKRIKTKESINIFDHFFESMIKDMQNTIRMNEERLTLLNDAKEFLMKYDCEVPVNNNFFNYEQILGYHIMPDTTIDSRVGK